MKGEYTGGAGDPVGSRATAPARADSFSGGLLSPLAPTQVSPRHHNGTAGPTKFGLYGMANVDRFLSGTPRSFGAKRPPLGEAWRRYLRSGLNASGTPRYGGLDATGQRPRHHVAGAG